ncbi:sugar phosphate isomerase/epimerase [bacterium]|nr:sugar phosphate isomerase/epimerase [bacterium]
MEGNIKRELAIYVNQLDSDFEGFVNLAAEAGFEYLCTQDSIEWLDLSKKERMRKIGNTKETVEKHGLKFLAHHSNPILLPDLDVKKSVEYLKNFIDELKEWEISFYVLHNRSIKDEAKPWRVIEEIGKEKFDEITAEVLKEVCDYASKFNISIALENLPYPYVKKIEEIFEIIEMVERENLGICFDSGHSYISTHSVYEELRKTGDRLFTTHFHDNFGCPEEVEVTDENIDKWDRHLMPGLGIINWVEINKILNEIGYKYPVAFEGIRGIEDKEDLLNITVKLWRTFESFAKEGGENEG